MAKDKLTPPKEAKGDTAHAVVRAILGTVPHLGSALAEAFNSLIGPPLEKRRDEWREQIAGAITELIEKVDGLTAVSLQENDAFISAVAHASQIALRSHQYEKRAALRNAILNVALDNAPDEDMQLMFLNMIDVLTPSHLRILRLFQAPEAYASARGKSFVHISVGGHGQIIEAVFPELRGQREFYDNLIRDLFARGLTSVERTGVTMSGAGLMAKRTTKMGDDFLKFIASPIDKASPD